jgi:glycerol-3-phosphate dehydrogenase
MPWKDRTLLGTTELLFEGDPDQCAPTKQETDYLLTTYAHYFPGRPREVLNSWAGLRVLPASSGAAFSRPRETHLTVDRESRPRSVSIYGGKLTGYRATAEKVVKRLQQTLPARERVADTRELPLV